MESNVLHIHEFDLAGMPHRMDRLIREYMPGFAVNRVQKAEPFQMGFPRGLHWSELAPLCRWADILHVHHISFFNKISHLLPDKPTVVTVHGAPDRQQVPTPNRQVALHVVHPDLKTIWPTATFIPNFIMPHAVNLKGRHPLRISVGQAAPHRLKHPEVFTQISKALGRVIDFTPSHSRSGKILNLEHIEMMSRHHFVWDNLEGTLGVDSIEAMSVGAIPITSLSATNSAGIQEFFQGATLPFPIFRDGEDIKERLSQFAKAPTTVFDAMWGCYSFWRYHWTPVKFAERFRQLYSQVATERSCVGGLATDVTSRADIPGT